MSEVASVLGVPPVFTYKGVEYKVCERDFEIEALAERKILDNGLRVIQGMRESLSPYDYQLMLDGHRRDGATRVYSFGTPEHFRWAISEEGQKYYAYLALKKLNPQVTQQLIDQIYDDVEVTVAADGSETRRKAAWEALDVKMAEANADPTPKAKTPA